MEKRGKFIRTEEFKEKLRKIKKGQGVGEKNSQWREKSHHWKGGISKKPYAHKNATRPKPEQCELCGIYGKELKKGLCYDHDHKTGKFRGWLCGRCNMALGMVNDNSELLSKMSEYVKPLDY
jgi:hypothetical protein